MRDDSLLVPAIAIFAVIIGFVAWPFIAILLHELGHAVAAKLVGVEPTHLIIGHRDGDTPLFSFRFFGCSVECWPLPFGGATIVAPPLTDRFKMFIFAIGGLAVDACMIVICLLLWQHISIRLGLAFVILSHSIDILSNLIPVSIPFGGVRHPSDGKVILQLLTRKR